MNDWQNSGRVLNNVFVTEELLNAGDSVMTYLCKSIKTWDFWVIKILRRAVYDSIDELRFYREFSAASNINHPNVISMKELFTHRDVPAIVMEYAPNGDLAQKLSKEARFCAQQTTKIALQIAEGLQAIHRAGIVHRDLKPENILFGLNDEVKIADFGIAHFKEKKRLTSHNYLLGTVGYMSPEYIEKGLVDEQSDIYALGVIMYEMITGRLPFVHQNGFEQLQSVINDEAPDVKLLCPQCPDQLAACIKKAMLRDRSARYQNVEELLRDLKGETCEERMFFENIGSSDELKVDDTMIFNIEQIN